MINPEQKANFRLIQGDGESVKPQHYDFDQDTREFPRTPSRNKLWRRRMTAGIIASGLTIAPWAINKVRDAVTDECVAIGQAIVTPEAKSTWELVRPISGYAKEDRGNIDCTVKNNPSPLEPGQQITIYRAE